ncbi:unnamed protein product [Microthlaspi erraticum]|uniref:Uncharacterized protein n=1 Tax=Microthlaspi erraticum TaxID=1685480 RepID=A0A6D2I6J7_9BRAS|nr:unnamed protein product [Microthlaspi erraticum]
MTHPTSREYKLKLDALNRLAVNILHQKSHLLQHHVTAKEVATIFLTADTGATTNSRFVCLWVLPFKSCKRKREIKIDELNNASKKPAAGADMPHYSK